MGLMAFYLGVIVLACTRRAGARWIVAGVLFAGVWTWANVTIDMVQLRQFAGEPWVRLVVIMSTVAAVALIASVLTVWKGERFYLKDRDRGGFQAALFLLTVALLFFTRLKVPFPILLVDRYLPGWGGLEVFGLGVYAAWIGTLMFEPRGSLKIRPRIWAFFSLVFFTQLGLGLLGLDRMLMTGALHLPVPALILGGPIFRGGGFFMLILYASTLLLVGPAWCSHLCYIGAWDDQGARLAGRKPRQGFPGPKMWGRALTLGLTVLTAIGLRLAGVPGLTAVWIAAGFGLVGVAIMVTLSRRTGIMAHCTTYCPMGLVSNLLGKINPWRIRLSSECTNCGTCAKFCRYGALDEFSILERRPGMSCTLCGDCVSICPHSAAEYRFPGLTAQGARLAFLIVTISLHAVFLGVARI
ncbi:MAG: 4Fe-4S binding protein [Proteobacteria bacterium]|nr:4Fe-4S binding protein [Pseudomonadota bacterium]